MIFPTQTIVAIYGSPRAEGNSDLLLSQAVEGARAAGGEVQEIVLRDLKMSPCVEDYGCLKSGRCVVSDDFQQVYDLLTSCQGLMLSSPVFFCAVSAHVKILMDRCQSFWVRKYLLNKRLDKGRRGLFISVAARKNRRNFDGLLMSMRPFFDALDIDLWKSLLYPGVDRAGAIQSQPGSLEECRLAGSELVRLLGSDRSRKLSSIL